MGISDTTQERLFEELYKPYMPLVFEHLSHLDGAAKLADMLLPTVMIVSESVPATVASEASNVQTSNTDIEQAGIVESERLAEIRRQVEDARVAN